ncbi:hypothetical protein Pflav_011080 [Phytohabitans flavus]|uniref:Uncharacterized protein n=1 Tax=Phytohabitans flavus TaxID=1076124 RepID=A0A6F8XLM3_9ACTN|nr:hypothetical protein Pflav_011080 [Phytohabitans flavus]
MPWSISYRWTSTSSSTCNATPAITLTNNFNNKLNSTDDNKKRNNALAINIAINGPAGLAHANANANNN